MSSLDNSSQQLMAFQQRKATVRMQTVNGQFYKLNPIQQGLKY